MRRFVVICLAVAALATPAAASGGTGSLGVAAGEITPTSALVWTRAGRAGEVIVLVSTDARRPRVVFRRALRATGADDLTVRALARGLRPATRYRYRFVQGRSTSPVGRFRTAPRANVSETIDFALSGDADGARTSAGRPFFNDFAVYAQMADERNDFNVNLGDTIYSDSEAAGVPPALTLEAKWRKYRENLAYPALRALRNGAALYSHWDDHEFVNDFSRAEHGEDIYRAGVNAFLDYAPVTYSAQRGLYRHFRWGRNAELFFLDERSFRSAKALAAHACDSPATGTPDLAPTAPEPVRLAFASLNPALATPVPQSCLDLIRSPDRTMLGEAQLERFRGDLTRSTATFKIVVNEVPLQQFYANPYDRWEGYEAERLRMIELLRGVPNVVVLTTDTHGNLVGDIRAQTLEAGGPMDSGVLEAVTGPVATNTFAREIDAVLGTPGAGAFVTALFFKPAPPRGIGMRCAATDVYSYMHVRVTSSRLTITPRDLNGEPVHEEGGAPCGPFVVTAR